jgi:hypothetical protein
MAHHNAAVQKAQAVKGSTNHTLKSAPDIHMQYVDWRTGAAAAATAKQQHLTAGR